MARCEDVTGIEDTARVKAGYRVDRNTQLPLLVLSHHGGVPGPFARFVREGRLAAEWEWDVTASRIAAARGVMLTLHLDQIRAMEWRDGFETMLAKGGRVLLNGHAERPFLPGVGHFLLGGKQRKHLTLSVLGDHPLFEGVDRLTFETRRGVAGFYGRGHNAMPAGAKALTGVGPDAAPLDWVLRRADGGAVLSHAGNDLWTGSEDMALIDRLLDNAVRWLAHETKA